MVDSFGTRYHNLSFSFFEGLQSSQRETSGSIKVTSTGDLHSKLLMPYLLRGTSVVQANSLFAFCGLACAVLESSDDVMSSRSKSEWIGAVVDTFLVVLDSNYVPVSSDVVKMCVKGNSRATSVVARSSAALCLAEISLNLLQCLPERLVQVLESLRRFGLGTMEKTSAIGEQW